MSKHCPELRGLPYLDQQALPVECLCTVPSNSEAHPYCLRHGRNHKQWFADAQLLDSRLGTLSYLPAEIREMIFANILFCDLTPGVDGFWEYEHRLGSPLDVSTYFFNAHHRSMDSRPGGLRQTSSSIKSEFEDVLLSKRTFRFNYPENLTAFMTRLNKTQLSRVFSIAMGICLMDPVDEWMKPVAKLPPNLKEIQFNIYTAFNDYVQPEALSALSDVVHEAARRVPNARIYVRKSGQQPLNQECQNLAAEFIQSQSHKQYPS